MRPPRWLQIWAANRMCPVVTFWNEDRTDLWCVKTVRAGTDSMGNQIYSFPTGVVLSDNWKTYTVSHIPARSVLDLSVKLGGPPGN